MLGGPRLWRERSREMRRWVSARWVAVSATRWSRTGCAGGARAALVLEGAVVEGCGKCGQTAVKAGAPVGVPICIAQWWAPLRRQQAGSLTSDDWPNASAEAATGRPKLASKRSARRRRMGLSVAEEAREVT